VDDLFFVAKRLRTQSAAAAVLANFEGKDFGEAQLRWAGFRSSATGLRASCASVSQGSSMRCWIATTLQLLLQQRPMSSASKADASVSLLLPDEPVSNHGGGIVVLGECPET
jgi:hypothetical protein